ncbi:MAG: protein kinase [Pirellulales bacterium]
MGKRRVIKVLSPQFANDDHFLARFEQEAKILASLRHPNIVRVYDFERDHVPPYIAMDVVEGPDGEPSGGLQQLIQQGRLTSDEAKRLTLQILDALECAHGKNIIHRDIKPGNVLIDARGDVQLVDFGIAAVREETSRHLTETGVSMGTRSYMAPEQRDAKRIDGRADLYAVGAMLYEMLTGNKAEGSFDPPSSVVPDLPPSWDAIVKTALRPNPEERFASAAAMSQAVQEVDANNLKLPQGNANSIPGTEVTTPDGVCFACRCSVRNDATFCPECGESLVTNCPQCQATSTGGGKFCEGCGYDLSRYHRASKHLKDGLDSLALAMADGQKVEDQIEHARAATIQLQRASKDAAIVSQATDPLGRARELYARCAVAIGQEAYTAKQLSKACEHFGEALSCIPIQPLSGAKLQRLKKLATSY